MDEFQENHGAIVDDDAHGELENQGVDSRVDDNTDDSIISNAPVNKSHRDEMMDYIIEKRAQVGDGDGDGGEDSFNDEVSNESDSSQTLTVKIDGIEQQIPIEQAKATIQKNLAADKRLNDAVLRQQALDQRERELMQRELQQQELSSISDDDVRDKLQSAIDAVYDGETEDAVEALAAVISGRNKATLDDPDQVKHVTDNVLREIQKKSYDDDVEKGNIEFAQEFPDIVNDSYLYNVANERTKQMLAEHPDWKPSRIIHEAGIQTREWINSLSGSNDRSNNSRMQYKRNLQNVPKSMGSVSYNPKESSNEESLTPYQIIQKMKSDRNQGM